jgi:hypothetical protein
MIPRTFPIFLLMAATITSVYSGYVLENHSKLVEGESRTGMTHCSSCN